jgi:hypothetical protein
MKHAKPKRAKAAKPRTTIRSSDKALINECVTYVQSVAAFRSGFEADPDGDYKSAETLGKPHEARARKALMKITATAATTPEGLQAKAMIVPFVFQDGGGACGEKDQSAFLQSFGENVKKFLRPIVDGTVIMQDAMKDEGLAA